MAASLAGVALAEVLVWPSVLMLMAMRCRSPLGGAAASLAALLRRSLAPHDGLQLLSRWAALHGCARRCRLLHRAAASCAVLMLSMLVMPDLGCADSGR